MRALLAALLFFSITVTANSQASPREDNKSVTPLQYRVLVRMADCKTLQCLDVQRKLIPDNQFAADVVFFTRQVKLHPSREAAAGLLRSIPEDDAEQLTFSRLCDWQDGLTESVHDMDALAAVYAEWPKLIAKAALIRPDMLTAYVRYLRIASYDIHSDFTGNAEKVCRSHKATFLTAFQSLPAADRKFIRKEVFQPETCTAIFRSEAE